MTEDRRYDDQVDRERLPAHVAIIMDGNGRWAKTRGWARTRGHQEGADSVRAAVRMCGRLGVREVTLYAFSTENWRRPKREVDFLMDLLDRFLQSERESIMENDVRVCAIGRLEALPSRVRESLNDTIEMSRRNTGLVLRLALNYGGRMEIADAVRKMVASAERGQLDPETIGPETLRDFLYEPGMSDPDLLIRTGGEMRLSNFLLWGLSYTELYVSSVYWPEFRERDLAEAFGAYARRDRRYGGVNESAPPSGRSASPAAP